MTIGRLIVAFAILLFAACIAAMNWSCLIAGMRNKRHGIDRRHSMVPVVSLVAAALAYLIHPRPAGAWAFAVPLLDIANWHLLRLPIAIFREARKKRAHEPKVRAGGEHRP